MIQRETTSPPIWGRFSSYRFDLVQILPSHRVGDLSLDLVFAFQLATATECRHRPYAVLRKVLRSSDNSARAELSCSRGLATLWLFEVTHTKRLTRMLLRLPLLAALRREPCRAAFSLTTLSQSAAWLGVQTLLESCGTCTSTQSGRATLDPHIPLNRQN